MSTPSASEKRPHVGRNIKRLRELRSITQDYVGTRLGLSQQAMSDLEKSEEVDEERLQKVAEVLGVTTEVIRRFNEEALFNNINNTFNDHSALINYQVNPIEKITELYEQVLKSEREKVALLERLLKTYDSK